MRYNEPDLKTILEKFDVLLAKNPDTPTSFFQFKNYIRALLRVRTKNINVPTSELMAVLKHQKPTIFKLLKEQSLSDNNLYFLTHIDMDYKQAEKKLIEIKEQLN